MIKVVPYDVKGPQWRRSRGDGGDISPPIFDQGGMAYVIIPPPNVMHI